jgi:GNAT superfamily N-acetyltransferase
MPVRDATLADVPEILAMVRELAVYEKAPHEVVATEQLLSDALFGPQPAVFALMAETPDGDTAGVALWFLNFSTWLGRHGVYLEDLYVRPEYRGRGFGRALLAHLAGICVERGYGRFEWWCLDWNEPALEFYRNIGAVPMEDWTVQRLTGQHLHDLAR